MNETSSNPTPPAGDAPVKKPRKPRTPKAKPPKKERVGLGPIRLVYPYGIDLQFAEQQPPDDIANDVSKVVAWASTVPELGKVKSLKLIRQYNVNLTISTVTKVIAKAEIENTGEVPQKQ